MKGSHQDLSVRLLLADEFRKTRNHPMFAKPCTLIRRKHIYYDGMGDVIESNATHNDICFIP